MKNIIDTLTFKEKIRRRIEKINSLLCVGLDSDFAKLPLKFKRYGPREGIFLFNRSIVQDTAEFAAAFKLNLVFYAGYGLSGLKALAETTFYLKKNYPEIPLIADCKRSEMQRSGKLAAREIFEEFNFDALTVTPWFGFDTIEPYLKYRDKGVFVLCKDSNPSAGEIQDLVIKQRKQKMKLYEYVTDLVVNHWNKNGNVFCEGPLTYPLDLKRIRQIAGNESLILIAGLGPQGGKVKDLRPIINKEKNNILVNASRMVIFAKKPAAVAKKIKEEINHLDNNAEIE